MTSTSTCNSMRTWGTYSTPPRPSIPQPMVANNYNPAWANAGIMVDPSSSASGSISVALADGKGARLRAFADHRQSAIQHRAPVGRWLQRPSSKDRHGRCRTSNKAVGGPDLEFRQQLCSRLPSTEARAKFWKPPEEQGTLDSVGHPGRGPDGGELATDIAWIGPRSATAVLVMISGTHGVEGFCGSGSPGRLAEARRSVALATGIGRTDDPRDQPVRIRVVGGGSDRGQCRSQPQLGGLHGATARQPRLRSVERGDLSGRMDRGGAVGERSGAERLCRGTRVPGVATGDHRRPVLPPGRPFLWRRPRPLVASYSRRHSAAAT